jgi:glycosyltransferase involved in cell wall biosynthesis
MNEIAHSKLCETIDKPWMTFFTPAYNRCNTLNRCYETLMAMKKPLDSKGNEVEFEWIIIDDGSSDNTLALVKSWCDENLIPMILFHQDNSGKHVAFNHAVEKARGFMFADIDSDDALLDTALQFYYTTWESIPSEKKDICKGVGARCIDGATHQLIGAPLPQKTMFVSAQDLRFKYNFRVETTGCNRVDILRKYPFPVFENKSSFCPESIVWYEIGKNYKEWLVDTPVRIYYCDSSDSLIKVRNKKRSYANFHLWQYQINNIFPKYIFQSPREMLKSYIGISRDGFIADMPMGKIISSGKGFCRRALITLFMPIGYLLSK